MKDNIIQFPIKKRLQEVEEERDLEEMGREFFVEECTETAQVILLMIEELLSAEHSSFDGIDFRDKLLPESKDMFVVVNMISSMLLRYGGVHHFLHEYLDVIYEKIMETHE